MQTRHGKEVQRARRIHEFEKVAAEQDQAATALQRQWKSHNVNTNEDVEVVDVEDFSGRVDDEGTADWE